MQAFGASGLLCPFPLCEGVKECPSLPLSSLLPCVSGRMGPIVALPGGTTLHFSVRPVWPFCPSACGCCVLKVWEPNKQSLPHMLLCCSGVFSVMGLIVYPWICSLHSIVFSWTFLSTLLQASPHCWVQFWEHPYLERQACCSQGPEETGYCIWAFFSYVSNPLGKVESVYLWMILELCILGYFFKIMTFFPPFIYF